LTTYELAALLDGLSALLRSQPDRSLLSTDPARTSHPRRRAEVRAGAAPKPLSGISLSGLSGLSKGELLKLVEQHRIPINIGKKDSATRVLRRVVQYLDGNKKAKSMIRNRVAHGKTSPRLTEALSYLLKDNYD
jgi:hypothetical protein